MLIWPHVDILQNKKERKRYVATRKMGDDMVSNGPFLAAEHFVVVFAPLNNVSLKRKLLCNMSEFIFPYLFQVFDVLVKINSKIIGLLISPWHG